MMKLYYSPGACSLADHISLYEAGFVATFEKVDLKTKITETGADFMAINPKGYVPVLVLDDGERVTENVAILYWIANRAPELVPSGRLGYYPPMPHSVLGFGELGPEVDVEEMVAQILGETPQVAARVPGPEPALFTRVMLRLF